MPQDQALYLDTLIRSSRWMDCPRVLLLFPITDLVFRPSDSSPIKAALEFPVCGIPSLVVSPGQQLQ